jgi:hypothetical protein
LLPLFRSANFVRKHQEEHDDGPQTRQTALKRLQFADSTKEPEKRRGSVMMKRVKGGEEVATNSTKTLII